MHNLVIVFYYLSLKFLDPDTKFLYEVNFLRDRDILSEVQQYKANFLLKINSIFLCTKFLYLMNILSLRSLRPMFTRFFAHSKFDFYVNYTKK